MYLALPELYFAIGRHESRDPKVRASETLAGNTRQVLSEAINEFALHLTSFFNNLHMTEMWIYQSNFLLLPTSL